MAKKQLLKTAIALTAWSAACTAPISEDNRPCPCAEGWICCEAAQLCAASADECPRDELTVEPDRAEIGAGRALAFAANMPVVWSIEENEGGQIDAGGRYRAPWAPGVYHVVATPAEAAPEAATTEAQIESARVEVTVVPRTLHLVAGQLGGAGDADGLGVAARFDRASGVAWSGGALYVADRQNHLIRKVDADSGDVTTVAGQPGSWGRRDGVGAAARLFFPHALADGGAGRLFILEGSYPTAIRSMSTATGEVVTDLEPCADQCWNFHALVAQSEEVLYAVGDLPGELGARIVRIDLAAGTVTPIAEIADRWVALALDGRGRLLLADSLAFVIRRLDLATGEMTVLAGREGSPGSVDGIGDSARFFQPQALVVDRPDSALIFENASSTTIRRLRLDTGEVTTLSVLATALREFGQPATDGESVWIADQAGQVIRKLDRLGTSRLVGVEEVAGLPAAAGNNDGSASGARFHTPAAIAIAPGFLPLVADSDSCALRTVDPVSAEVRTLAGSALFCSSEDGVGRDALLNHPAALTLSEPTALLIGEHGLRRLDLETGSLSTIATGIGYLRGLAAAEGNETYAISSGPFGVSILAIAPSGAATPLAGSTTHQGCADGVGDQARFTAPSALAWDGRGTLYVADWRTLRQIDVATAEVTTIAGSCDEAGLVDGIGSAARFSQLAGLTFDAAGDLWISDAGNGSIRRFDPQTRAVTTIVGDGRRGVRLGGASARLNAPSDLAFAANGDLLITDRNENAVLVLR